MGHRHQPVGDQGRGVLEKYYAKCVKKLQVNISDSHFLSMNHMCKVWFVNLAWYVSVCLQVFWWRDVLTILVCFYVARTR